MIRGIVRGLRGLRPTPWLVLPLGALLLLPVGALAQPLLTDDAYVTPALPNGNFGGGLNLVVQSPATSSYIRFDLGSALPPGVTAADVAQANLRLFINAVNRPGLLDVRVLSGTWSEATITYNHAPAQGPLAMGAVAVTARSQFIDIDITDA